MRKAAFSRPRVAAAPSTADPPSAVRPTAPTTGRGVRAASEIPVPAIAKLLEQGFRAAAAKAVSDAHAAGLPVATVDPQGRPVWRHPDGTLEAMTDPTRIPVRP